LLRGGRSREEEAMESGCHGRRVAASQGKGEGRPNVGERGVEAKKGKKGGRATTRVSLREKRNDATDDSDLASNGPQPFSHIHAPKINLWQHFLGYYTGALHMCDRIYFHTYVDVTSVIYQKNNAKSINNDYINILHFEQT
jgi:hypothetical protein